MCIRDSIYPDAVEQIHRHRFSGKQADKTADTEKIEVLIFQEHRDLRGLQRDNNGENHTGKQQAAALKFIAGKSISRQAGGKQLANRGQDGELGGVERRILIPEYHQCFLEIHKRRIFRDINCGAFFNIRPIAQCIGQHLKQREQHQIGDADQDKIAEDHEKDVKFPIARIGLDLLHGSLRAAHYKFQFHPSL